MANNGGWAWPGMLERKGVYVVFFLAVLGILMSSNNSMAADGPVRGSTVLQWFEHEAESVSLVPGFIDYLRLDPYPEDKGRDWAERKRMLILVQSYVNEKNDVALNEFHGGKDSAARALEKGKAAMVFHMLKETVGEDAFKKTVEKYASGGFAAPTSWAVVRSAFESVSGRDLGWFFNQWTERKGAPVIILNKTEVSYQGARAVVRFEVSQKGEPYRLKLPVVLKTISGEIRKSFDISKANEELAMETDSIPEEITLDKDYDVFRILREDEFPPVLSRLLGDQGKFYVLPQGQEKDFLALSEYLGKAGFSEKKETEVSYENIKSSSFIVIGSDTELTRRLFGVPVKTGSEFSLTVHENAFNSKGVIIVINGLFSDKTGELIGDLSSHEFSSGVVVKNKTVTKEPLQEARRGLGEDLRNQVSGIEISHIVDLPDVIAKARDKDVIYVGEIHDRFEHHRVQYEIIRALHERDPKIAIGMEMFQRPFQNVLDDYIAGTINEKEFLKRSEYFKRWGFDYNLYREILLYAREFRIPVIALNIKKEVVTKVSKSGIFSLSVDEKKELPEDIDFSDSVYENRLREYYFKHAESARMNFDFFYQAQVLWDESMAHNLSSYMSANPDRRIVVLAGSGHMAFGSGIPKRLYRLNKKKYSVILNFDEISPNIADFVLMAEPVSWTESPKLNVILKEVEGKLKISGFAPGSVAEKAGMQEDDSIVSINGQPISTVEDIKLLLYDKKKGDELTVKVSRSRFIFGSRLLDLRVIL